MEKRYKFQKLYEAIVNKGYTPKETSQKIGISYAMMTYLLLGKRRFCIDNMIKLSELLEVDMETLFKEDYLDGKVE